MAVADMANPTVVPAGTCSGSVMVGAQATFPDLVTLTISTTTTTTIDVLTRRMTLMAPMFQLNHKATDLPGFTHSSSPSSAADVQGGLSARAAAGVGVGATLGAVSLAAVVVLIWRRKRRQRAAVAGPEGIGIVPENTAWDKQQSPWPTTELHAGYLPAELHTSNSLVELPESLRTAPPSHMDGSAAHR
jgi:hypothetical protein